jgi:hypothetical protein
MSKNIMVFDVESTSLYGRGFAVGAIVCNIFGEEIDSFELMSTNDALFANDWVKNNVLPCLTEIPTCNTGKELRTRFFDFYMKHRDTCDVWSDCNFPVETNFLREVVKDDEQGRQWVMPYPLKDISTIVPIDIDRAVSCPLKNLRKHNPIDDCRASYYHLFTYLYTKPI